MAQDTPQRAASTTGGLGGWAGLMVLSALAAYGGLITARGPLVSPRPHAPSLWREPSLAGRAPARLWQDPLRAVCAQFADKGTGLSSALEKVPLGSEVAKEILQLTTGKPAKSVLLLPVVISGDSTPDSEEGRLTNRYAVLSALGAASYVPEDRQNIRYFRCGFPEARPAPNSTPKTLDLNNVTLIPYEWFNSARAPGAGDSGKDGSGAAKAASERYDSVLVLWLRSDRLDARRRLAMLSQVLSSITDADAADWTPNRTPLWSALRVLGPTDSNMLVDMLAEDARLEARDCPLSALQDARFYPWSATISQDALYTELRRELVGEPKLLESARWRLSVKRGEYELKCTGPGGSLVRPVGDDEQLAGLLVHELKLRNSEPVANQQHVAIVYEWDTVYARSLVQAFKSAADLKEEDATTIVPFTYLRGIDGYTPDQEEARESGGVTTDPSRKDQPGAPGADRAVVNSAAGRSQFDYIRRLMEQIKAQDSELGRTGRGGFRAVGVFGSDMYDKIPLVQALKDAFPDKLIFTTNLYARLSDPTVYNSFRNTITASHFDLRLGEVLQRSVPPFRTGGQTALYFSTLLALADSDAKTAYENAVRDDKPGAETIRGRVFEIARSGAFDLSLGGSAANPSDQALYPPRARERPLGLDVIRNWLAVVMVGCFGSALIAMAIYSVRGRYERYRLPAHASQEQVREKGRENWMALLRLGAGVFVLGVAIPVVVLGVFYWIGASKPDEEPFAWLQGISIWPGEFLRVLACVLCVFFLWRMYHDLRANSNWITRVLVGPIPDKERAVVLAACLRAWSKGPDRIRKAWEWFESISIVGWVAVADPGTNLLHAPRLWRDHMRRGEPLHRAARIVPMLLLYALVVVGMALWFRPPDPPCRGPISHGIDWAVTIISLIAINIVTFTVWDATRLCERFVRNLCVAHSDWGGRADLAVGHPIRQAEAVRRDIQIIAERTESVGRTIYYPFITLAIVALSASGRIDHWPWSFSTVAAYCISAGVAVVAASSLRSAAEGARAEEIERLKNTLYNNGLPSSPFEHIEPKPKRTPEGESSGDLQHAIESGAHGPAPAAFGEAKAAEGGVAVQDAPKKQPTPVVTTSELPANPVSADEREQIKEIIQDILDIRRGAFGPFSQTPLLRAVLIPFGSLGAVQLLQLLEGLL